MNASSIRAFLIQGTVSLYCKRAIASRSSFCVRAVQNIAKKSEIRLTVPTEDAAIRVIDEANNRLKEIVHIPLTENVKKALIKQKEIDLVLGRRAKEQKVDGEKGLIFITRNGTPINSRNFGKALDGLVKAYNRKEVINAESEHRDPVLLPHINPHMLRHTFCTRCAEAGLDIKVLQMIMGHSDISITMNIYNHVDAARVQNEMKKLENVM